MEIIVLEVSHWHTLLHLDPILQQGNRIVAVSDRDSAVANTIAERVGARMYSDWRTLLSKEHADFAFAFGRHCEMPIIGEALVERRIPFVMEKPCGINASQVRRLRDLVKKQGLFVGVPFIQSFGPLAEMIADRHRDSGPQHMWCRFIAGPPARYPAAGSGWMLDPEQSGGGCFMNLAGHFIDLVLRSLPGVERVYARMSSAVYNEKIEDYALATLSSPDGSTAVVETGYLYPSEAGRVREVYYSVFGRNGCRIWWGEQGGTAFHGEPWAEKPVNLDSNILYPDFIAATLAAFRAGKRPPVGLDEMVSVMDIIESAYASARSGQPVTVSVKGYGASHA